MLKFDNYKNFNVCIKNNGSISRDSKTNLFVYLSQECATWLSTTIHPYYV